MKQVNLYVWLVLSALLVLVGMMLIGAVTSAMAEVPLELHPCHAKTCAAVDADTQKVLGQGDTLLVLPSEVSGVQSVHGCADCTKLHTRSKQTVYVLGAPRDVACSLFGGVNCYVRSK